jgi:hypothetical protein
MTSGELKDYEPPVDKHLHGFSHPVKIVKFAE